MLQEIPHFLIKVPKPVENLGKIQSNIFIRGTGTLGLKNILRKTWVQYLKYEQLDMYFSTSSYFYIKNYSADLRHYCRILSEMSWNASYIIKSIMHQGREEAFSTIAENTLKSKKSLSCIVHTLYFITHVWI